jgi:predicted nucleic acid-binding protein
MTTLFADTYYYIAMLSPKDSTHAQAVALTARLQPRIVTTAWVLTELAAAMSAPAKRERFLKLFDVLSASDEVKLIPASAELFDVGLALYRSRPDKGWSLTDCISFLVMEREGLTEALTGDHHFEQAGFTALLK